MNSLRPARFASNQTLATCVAALIMAIAMGFARFAFTGIYPLMVKEGVLTLHQGSLAASANYAGYLIGALLSAAVAPGRSRRLCMFALASVALCLGLTAAVTTPWLIILIRGVTGVASAVAMVAASLWLLQHRGHTRGAPLLYSGVGAGILLSSEILVMARGAGLHSAGLWWILTAASVVLGAIAMLGLIAGSNVGVDSGLEASIRTGLRTGLSTDLVRGDDSASKSNLPVAVARSGHEAFSALSAIPLIALYGLAGFGYIITATYLPLFVKQAGVMIDPLQVWALFGLGAIPSCFIWHALHMRYGTRRGLALNLMVQAFGVILPLVAPDAFGYLGSALLVGGTFMGIVTIAMLAARRVAHTVRVGIMALMTACFGLGQIVGPLIANLLYAADNSFNGSLLTAAAALTVAALLCVRLPMRPLRSTA
jgi:MFS family permease